jgi:hypothetical protein
LPASRERTAASTALDAVGNTSAIPIPVIENGAISSTTGVVGSIT